MHLYLSEEVVVAFDNAIRAIINDPGLANRAIGVLQFNSMYRTYEEQDALFKAWLARGKTGNPVADPGTSRHESGFAFDINGVTVGRTTDANGNYVKSALGELIVPIFERFGFVWKGDALKDPPHFEADPLQHGFASRGAAIEEANRSWACLRSSGRV